MFTYIRFQNHSLEKWMTVTLLTLVQQSMVILFFLVTHVFLFLMQDISVYIIL